MTMLETTTNLRLPLLQPGQAQKEMFHNEALALIDLAMQPCVVAVGIDVPPVAPDQGACWIVGRAPGGDWAGRRNMLAGWTAGGWRFVGPRPGMAVWSITDAAPARFIGGEWIVQAPRAAIPDPAGGAVIDADARSTLAAVLAALRDHRLIDP